MLGISITVWSSIAISLLAIVLSMAAFRIHNSNRKIFRESMAKLEEARDNLIESGKRLKRMNDELDKKLGIGED